jgi:hypothetical protein
LYASQQASNHSPLIGGGFGAFLFITTSEKKNGLLLIETFRKLFNPKNYGHLDQLRVDIYSLSGGSKNFAFLSIPNSTDDAVGFTITVAPHLL